MSETSVIEKLKVARLVLLLKNPFFGEVATHLKLIENNTACKTLATDGRNMYYNSEFVDALTIEQLKFGICHEILHCAFEHFTRVGDRKRDLWNVATDYAINWILYRDKIGEVIKAIPSLGITGILLDEKYKDMPAEEIYDRLLKEGNYSDKQSFDTHIYISQSGDGDGEEKKDSNGKGDGQKDGEGFASYSASDAKEIKDEMRDTIINAIKNEAASNHDPNKQGLAPGELVRMVKEYLEPKINWRELLTNTIQSRAKSDTSFMRPSRKSDQFILPGRVPEDTIKVACSIDTSGSISDNQINDFLSEIRGIMTQYPSFEVSLWSFDTKCGALAKFTEDNADEIDEWVPYGGGGTHIAANWKFMIDNEIDADTFIIFTDLCDSSQNSVDEGQIDTVWIINNPYDKEAKPPFGTYARYE